MAEARDPKKLYFTVVRNMVGDKAEKPNGFLFAAREKPSDATMEQIFQDLSLREMLPANKPVLCLRYLKAPVALPDFLPEWRVVLTTLSYYAVQLHDERDTTTVLWEEPGPDQQLVTKTRDYKDVLMGCGELYRAVGCDGCQKKGLKCVEQNFGYRPWFMLFSYNRKDEWSTGLADEGSIGERKDKNIQHEFRGKDYESIVARCATMHAPGGAIFVDPSESRPLETPKMFHPLRPCRDHRFFRDPLAQKK